MKLTQKQLEALASKINRKKVDRYEQKLTEIRKFVEPKLKLPKDLEKAIDILYNEKHLKLWYSLSSLSSPKEIKSRLFHNLITERVKEIQQKEGIFCPDTNITHEILQIASIEAETLTELTDNLAEMCGINFNEE